MWLLASLLWCLLGGGVAQAAIVLEQWGAATQQANDINSTTFPAAPTEGNLLVAIVGNRTASAPPPTPAGWNLAIESTGNLPGQIIFYKIAGPSEPASLTVGPYPAPLNTGFHLYEYSGVSIADPLGGSSQTTGSGTTVSSGNVTTSKDGSLILAGFTAAVGTTYDSWTNGFFEQWDFKNVGSPAQLGSYAGVDFEAGTAGTYSTTGTIASGDWIGQTVVFNPLPPPSVVTNTANSGYGSLREAIDYSNLNPGTTITFDIPDTDPGYQTSGSDHWWRIEPTSELSPITASAITIDGATQTANRGDVNSRGPEVELYGANAGGGVNGLQLDGSGAVVRGLVINSFSVSGIEMASASNTIEGCYLGTNAIGTLGLGNSAYGIDINNVASNTIGGTTAAARNVISGNLDDGIILWNVGATLNVIQGNYIGLNATGSGPVGNVTNGVKFGGGAHNNTVGGSTPAERNLISGNEDGIQVSENGSGNKIYGNFIGTDVGGTSPVPNLRHGVVIYNGANGTLVGGSVTGQGNVISGNALTGIVIDGNDDNTTTANKIVGNHIGVDVTGDLPLGNGSRGIDIFGKATANNIGGTNADEGNIISGNDEGIRVSGTGTDSNFIQGNFIGTNAAGTADLGNSLDGIVIYGGPKNTTIGGTTPGSRNIIAGNGNDGIWLTGAATTSNTVQGNWIGIGTDDSALGNTFHGIGIEGDANNNTIGGTVPGAGNRIGNSAWDGIAVANGNGSGNSLLGNSIFSSGNLGIDLDNDGVSDNDADDGDLGPNGLQNHPVLGSALTNGTTLITISGTLDAAASATYRIEFFANATADVSGHGEGEVYLGSVDATTDVNGDASFSAPLTVAVTGDAQITATATAPDGSTSEFAANVAATLLASNEISGTVFEDADFAGTATNWDGGVGDQGLANVDVELYDGSDNILASTTTAGDGSFSFTGLADGSYKVRVRSATIGDADTPPAGGLHPSVPGTWPYPLAEMSWGYGMALIGGQDLAVDDTAIGDNLGPGDTWVSVTVSGSSVSGVNVGFSYDLITNGDDDTELDTFRSKQGSLRQFIKNSNAIVGVNKSWFQIAIP